MSNVTTSPLATAEDDVGKVKHSLPDAEQVAIPVAEDSFNEQTNFVPRKKIITVKCARAQ